MAGKKAEIFAAADRPQLALITNHGYGGVEIPIGGAPDTGGQNVYVNRLAEALDALGYKVTVFARGGFPFFDSQRLRAEAEYLTDHVRYVYVPGGGDQFIRKEDIAVALDEEIDWLDKFIRREAEQLGCKPWQLYEVVNSHYWDAAVMGMRLVERWRNDVVADAICRLLEPVLDQEKLQSLRAERHWAALGEAPAYQLGKALISAEGSPATPLIQRVRAAASKWVVRRGDDDGTAVDRLVGAVANALAEVRHSLAPALHQLPVAQALGLALLELVPEVAGELEQRLLEVDRHVWTPHSLAALKEDNFRDKSPEIKRALKFCERRNHERTICNQTLAFAATSIEIAERLLTHYHVPYEQIFYFPPCVDRRTFRVYSQDELEEAYRYLSRMSDVPVEKLRQGKILFETSRMDHTKRKDLLLEAFSFVARERPDAYLFIGGGPEHELLGQLRALRDSRAELRGRAFLTGFIPEELIGPLFSLADIYVTASEMEGFGMSVLQAAASATAVISSDLVPFAVQYVPQEAVIVPAGETYDFARAMLDLIEDENDRRERARRLQEKTAAFDWRVQAQAFLDYLRGCGWEIAPGKQEES